ncbi:AbrB/MazE/SpoVT family DNA-binding domain-containing protein [Devosia sp. SL43]|uniref:AbrB/MazE/SpoVT family DNA-binding domain-containing protein n=1 Tax=Devosia sp. SL43 TaxID=2806348 RepID=UPI001F222F6A|nr:AbrB/MazE/SpoVT family DNA-binding domain-containing protein [Devosia sp. SL43]UJW87350.1 AbrB/MazE/SpoVT family DNA-binding domain-containing protein [Devosia sp. SL43]
MATATVTSKGQMTLPKDVRDDLGLRPGDKVEFIKRDGRYIIMPRNVPVASLAGILGKSPAGSMSIDEEEEAYAAALAEDDERIRAGR